MGVRLSGSALRAVRNQKERPRAAASRSGGYVLANGDKRVFVVVDIAGDIHSLNRQITSAKAKDIREKIADIDPANLPNVAEAQEI